MILERMIFMIKLTNLKIDGEGWAYTALPTLVSLGDCWDYNSFLRSIRHLLLDTNIDKRDFEMEETDMSEPILSDVLFHTDVLCIATQLKDEQEIKSLQIMVDLAVKNNVRYIAIMLCNTKSRNHEQEQALSRLKGQVNAIIDFAGYNSISNGQVNNAVSCIVRAIFAPYIFMGIIGLDLEDLRSGIKEHDVAIAAIVKETIHHGFEEKILQAATEQISMQHRDLRQAHNVYFAVFGNENTIGMGTLQEILPGAMENNVVSATIDNAMKDEEVLVVTIASGFKK